MPWKIFVVFGVLAILAYYTLPLSTPTKAALDVVFPLANVVGILLGIRWYRPDRMRPWALFAIGMSFFLLYNGARTVSILLDGDLGKAPGQDIFQSIGYLLIITALMSLIYSRDGGARDRSSLIDASIVVVGAAILVWTFVMAPFAHDSSIPVADRLFKMMYPFANLILLAVSVRLAVTRGARTPAFLMLLVAMVASLIGNTLSLSVVEGLGYLPPSNPIGIAFFAAYVFAGAAPMHPSMRALTDVGDYENRLTRTRIVLFMCASAAGVAAYVIEKLRGNKVDVPIILGGSFLIFVLVLFRLSGLNKAMRRGVEALRVSEQSSRLLFESSPLPMWVYDTATLRFLAVNDAAVDHYGYSRDEFLAMTIAEIRPEAELERLHDNLAQSRDDLEHSGEWIHRLKGGSLIDVDIASHSLKFGESEAVLVVAQDISERKKVEGEKEKLAGQLRQAQKLEAVGQLAGGIAHDFNNLLAVIVNYTRFVKDEIPEGSPAEEDLAQILNASDKATTLVKQLLAFSRREIVKPEVVDVNDVVSDIQKMLMRTIKESINLVVDLGDDVWNTEADRGQLEQVLLNLAVNADAAMPKGGTLEIRTSNRSIDEDAAAQKAELTAGDYVWLSVSDDGEGMSEKTMAHIFEPFFTTKGIGEGTGLGLSTVYGIVKQAHGYIYVYSEEGRGTTFNIYLPASDAVPVAERQTRLEPGQHRGSETILVVEDEDGVRAIAHRVLTAAGYDVLTAATPAAALALANDGRAIDLMLTDVIMPGLSGRDLAAKMHAAIPRLKIIFMSGYTDEIIARQGVLDEGVTFIQKPFSAEELLPLVREVLDNEQRSFGARMPGVLIVDDEKPMREVLRLILETSNFTVIGEAADGEQAVKLARDLRPDVILLDYSMPGMNGAQAAPHLRNASPEAKICAFSAVLADAPSWADVYLPKDRIRDLTPTLAALAG